ncbi:outer membrane lipoprotein-sorting protein [Sphaerotilus microaerophilus]|jgi:hypothetical protein|nr:outer membrane lipoprotein-sorting protein [Sphaerotilus sp. FB-5]
MTSRPVFRALGLAAALGLLGLVGVVSPARAADDIATLLVDADRYRTGSEHLVVETQVSVFGRDGSLDKERRYTVYAQGGHRSLVLMRSPAEAGQKVLMLGDDFWLLMPGSQRPMRITPSQKLLGDASTGDIATLRWAEDYSGTLVGEERCEPVSPVAGVGAGAAQPCLHLSLQAARKGVTYQRIELWIGKRHHEPLRAELYVQSDKLAKQARFITDRPANPRQVEEMVLLDQLASHKETRVKYLSRAPKTVPEAWLNPMFLARNPSLE